MKKRILSAALALAMVLTLLPSTAFAVEYDTPGEALPSAVTNPKTGKQFYDDSNPRSIKTVTVTRCTARDEQNTGREYGEWYWLDNQSSSTTHKYYKVTSGIVTGTSGSGQWYPNVGAYTNDTTDKVKGAFTFLGGTAPDLENYKDTSLTIDFASSVASLTVPKTITSLTLTAKFTETNTGNGVAAKGQVGAITTARGTYTPTEGRTGLTINATNIAFGTITMVGRANTLNLTNCTVGAVSMNGETDSNADGSNKSYNAQTIKAITSTITSIDITNSSSGGVTLQDSTVGSNPGTAGAVNFSGDGGTINVSGLSTVGTITVNPRTKTGQYASVNISGGTVTGVTQGTAVTGNGNAIRITVTGSNTKFGTIDAEVNGTVSITDADGDSVTVDKGTLTIGGSGVDIENDVTLGEDDKTTLNMNASGSTFGGIKAFSGKGVNLTINSWNGARWTDGGNNYGTLDLDNYSGKKVTGGSFALSATPTHENVTNFGSKDNMGWFDSNLLFFVNCGDHTRLDLYKKDELARAISDVGTDVTGGTQGTGGYINVLGQLENPQYLVLKNGDVVWAYIAYNATTPLILPDRINNVTITNWLAEGNHNVKVPAGTETNVPFLGSQLYLNATGTSTAVGRITKASTAVAGTGSTVQNQNVTVKLEGNNISVSGAVTPNAGGIATVLVDLETDVVQSGTISNTNPSGSYLVIRNVLIDYNVNTKKVSFNTIQPAQAVEAGILVQDGMLVLNYGTGEKYTVSANLTESASNLGIMVESAASDNIQVTFGGKLSSWTAKQKEDLTKKLAEPANTSFTYGANQAMQQAINAAQATITSNNTVDSWITNAKNTIWRQGFKSPTTSKNTNYGYMPKLAPNTGTFNANTDSGTEINAKFAKAYIVPYLVVNVTDYNGTNGTMTATLTPYFRVDVSAPDNYVADVAYTVQQGKPLTLTGDMFGSDGGSGNLSNQITVEFNLDTAFANTYMHQDGKYVYAGTTNSTKIKWSITHIGANGSLGTVEINSHPGLVEIDGNAPYAISSRVPTVAQLNCTYDTLQAAIDDTVRGVNVQNDQNIANLASEKMDTVTIDGRYTGSCAITMSGIARRVRVVAEGQQDVTCNTQNVDVQNTGGFTYIVQLKQDNVPAGTVAIGVTSGVTGGTASLSLRSAKAGQTVTVTLIPDNGRSVQSVTAKTNTGVTVTLTPTGNANEYSFTVPTGATSITVTPSFKTGVALSKVAVNVANTGTGSVTTTAASTQNQVDPGTTVGVTTYPATGYRTMGVSVTGATATRVSDNYFTFVAPAGAAAVTVTPSYDRDNGTKFSDVWSTEYYSDAVAWAVSKGITNGQSTYVFGSSMSCSRAEMVTFLWRAAGKPSVTGVSNPFTDVAPGSYYYDAVLWAVSKGITNGLSSTYFGVSKPVTRAEMATFLYRYEGAPATGANSGFVDVPANQWYSKAVTWAVGKGVTNGKTTTTFAPSDACKRAEVVTFLYRDINGVRA